MIDARKLRKEIGDIGFEYSVRRWRDGSVWVIPTLGRRDRTEQLALVLNDLGYRTECNGKPGTAGQFIVDVFPKD
jgi:hypothetical protein